MIGVLQTIAQHCDGVRCDNGDARARTMSSTQTWRSASTCCGTPAQEFWPEATGARR
jgi:hypothetical protein